MIKEKPVDIGILQENAPDALLVTDHHKLIRFFNTSAEQLFGYKREELIGEKVDVLISGASNGNPFYPESLPEKSATGLNGNVTELLGSSRKIVENFIFHYLSSHTTGRTVPYHGGS